MACSFPFVYRVYGLTLMSDMRLTLPQACAERSDLDKVVRLETAGAEKMPLASDAKLDPELWFEQRFFSNGTLYLYWKDWFDFVVSAGGGCVSCRNLSDRPLELFDAYLTNFAVSAALVQQGEETLHATVVDIGERAIGLLGACGAGKSTLASFFRSRGADIVTDDMLRVDIGNEAVLAHPGPHRLKLFREPAELFLPQTSQSGRWSPVGGKFIYDLGDPTKARQARRLTALYYLQAPDQTDNKSVVLERLAGLDLFRTIGGSTMVNGLDRPGRPERHFRFVKRLANRLPVYRLTYPRSFDIFDEVVDKIFASAPA